MSSARSGPVVRRAGSALTRAAYRARRYARALRACSVERVDRSEARRVHPAPRAARHTGNARFRRPAVTGRTVASVFGFGHGRMAGGDAVLERGATLRRAPPNAASYRIARALRHGRRELGSARRRRLGYHPRFGEAGWSQGRRLQALPAIEASRWRSLCAGRRERSDAERPRHLHAPWLARRSPGQRRDDGSRPARQAWQWCDWSRVRCMCVARSKKRPAEMAEMPTIRCNANAKDKSGLDDSYLILLVLMGEFRYRRANCSADFLTLVTTVTGIGKTRSHCGRGAN